MKYLNAQLDITFAQGNATNSKGCPVRPPERRLLPPNIMGFSILAVKGTVVEEGLVMLMSCAASKVCGNDSCDPLSTLDLREKLSSTVAASGAFVLSPLPVALFRCVVSEVLEDLEDLLCDEITRVGEANVDSGIFSLRDFNGDGIVKILWLECQP